MPNLERLLLIHNYYRSGAPSGENRVFDLEVSLLKSRNHNIECLILNNDDIDFYGFFGKVGAAMLTPFNPFFLNKVKSRVIKDPPSLVHIHNTFPMISPAVLNAVEKRLPTVVTLHNYRLFCSKAIPVRDGKNCLDCLTTRSVFPALMHGCYRDNILTTMPVAMMISLHNFLDTWNRCVDAFIVLSEFQKDLMIQFGLDQSKIHIKPNFTLNTKTVIPWKKRHKDCIYVGRLSSEKGVRTLINVWKRWGVDAPSLTIIGEGNLREELESAAKGLPIHFLGQLSESNVKDEMAHSKLLIVPSECLETFGLVVVEAMSLGTPVLVSTAGALPNLVCHGSTGIVFKTQDINDLERVLRSFWIEPSILESLGHAGRSEYEEKYHENANYDALIDIYDRASFQFNRRGSCH
jgi:glycosyltransferase involved in cell wall biosynthesis